MNTMLPIAEAFVSGGEMMMVPGPTGVRGSNIMGNIRKLRNGGAGAGREALMPLFGKGTEKTAIGELGKRVMRIFSTHRSKSDFFGTIGGCRRGSEATSLVGVIAGSPNWYIRGMTPH